MSKNINPFELSDDEYRAVLDIYDAITQTIEEAYKTHGIDNTLQAMLRFTADFLVSVTDRIHPSLCPTEMTNNFGEIVGKLVTDTVRIRSEIKKAKRA